MISIKVCLFVTIVLVSLFGSSLSNWNNNWGWGYSNVYGPEPWTLNYGYKFGNKKADVWFNNWGKPAKCHGWGWDQKCHGGWNKFEYGAHIKHDAWKHKGWGWH